MTSTVRFHLFILTLASLLVHGLLFMNQGIFWDDWIYYHGLQENNFQVIYRPFAETGRPLHGLFIWSLGYFPNSVFAGRVFVFFALGLSAVAVYQSARLSKIFHPRESLILALMALSFPAMRATLPLVVAPHVIAYFFSLLGLACLFRLRYRQGQAYWFTRLMALLCFVLSFNLESTFVVIYGFLLWVLGSQLKQGASFNVHTLWRFGLQHLDFLLIGPAYWMLNRYFSPNTLASYNEITLDWSLNSQIMREALLESGLRQAEFSIQVFFSSAPLSIFLALGLVIGFVWQNSQPRFKPARYEAGLILGLGLILLFLGLLPYALVGKVAEFSSWESRHAIHVPLALGLIGVAMWRILSPFGIVRFFLAAAFLSGNILGSIQGIYLLNHERWLRDQSLSIHLASLEAQARPYNTFWVQDDYWYLPYPDRDGHQFINPFANYYRAYEWAGLFEAVWQHDRQLGISLKRRGQPAGFFPPKELITSDPASLFFIPAYEDKTCHALVLIRRGPAADSPWALWQRDWQTRGQTAERKIFLHSLSQVQIVPLPLPEMRHCKLAISSSTPAVFNPRTNNESLTLNFYLADAVVDSILSPIPTDPWADLAIAGMRYEGNLDLDAPEQAKLDQWRQNKRPQALADLGFQFLFIDSSWLGFLSDMELELITQSEAYRLVAEWYANNGLTFYRLYALNP